MFRRLLISATCTALLAGCVSSGYTYRADRGDYYYGQPRVEYYDHGYAGYGAYGWPGYGYYGPYRSRYPGYGYGRIGFGVTIGHPGFYGHYGSGWGGYPYYDTRPRHHPRYRRPPGGYAPYPGNRPNRDGSPWRNLDDVRRRQIGPGGGQAMERAAPQMQQRAIRADRDGSNAGRMIRQSREAPQRDSIGVSEQEP